MFIHSNIKSKISFIFLLNSVEKSKENKKRNNNNDITLNSMKTSLNKNKKEENLTKWIQQPSSKNLIIFVLVVVNYFKHFNNFFHYFIIYSTKIKYKKKKRIKNYTIYKLKLAYL